jgi:hypothetical protein
MRTGGAGAVQSTAGVGEEMKPRLETKLVPHTCAWCAKEFEGTTARDKHFCCPMHERMAEYWRRDGTEE